MKKKETVVVGMSGGVDSSIVDTLEDYGEKTSTRLTELNSFNKMKKYGTVLVAAYDNDAADVA